MWTSLAFAVLIGATLIRGEFLECHDDVAYNPQEGPVSELQFMWLGALQYIHVKKGNPHYFRVPRVILITRQFVVSTANDASSVPEGYALGNVVFTDYELDEEECNVTPHDVKTHRTSCDPGILIMPVADVLLHPEYKNFKAKTSVALMKLFTAVESDYVVPVCLPLRDFLSARQRPKRQILYHVDFMSDVPRDFIEEDKEISILNLLPRELCFLYDNPYNGTKAMKERVTCTTGCGFRSGAPILIHERTGHWTVVAITQGGSPCPDPLRERRPPAPAQHILLHPYVPWITTAISGSTLGIHGKDDPFGLFLTRATSRTAKTDPSRLGWVGHWWMGGERCYDRAVAADDLFRFYHEVFQVLPVTRTIVNYYLMISSGASIKIVCVKVGMPFRLGIPTVWDIGSNEIRLKVPLVITAGQYSFQVEAWGYNEGHWSTYTSESSSISVD